MAARYARFRAPATSSATPPAMAAMPTSGWQWQCLFSIGCRVYGADVDDGLTTRVGDTLIDQRRHAKHDQRDTENREGSHAASLSSC